jgi:hypothetical protein
MAESSLLNLHIRLGGPRAVQLLNLELDVGGGGNSIGDIGGGGDIGAPPPPNNINLGDVSGGNTSQSVAQSADQIEEFAAEGGGVLPIVYGEHLIAGILIVHKFVAGTPNTSIIIVALGEGQGGRGNHGEWNAALKVWYAGEELSVSPNGSTAGYRFHPGVISTGIADPFQPVDAFLPSGLAYSGTAIIAVKLPDAIANEEDRPDKLRGRYQGRGVFDYNVNGQIINYAYSVNPAQVAADRVRAYYEHKITDPVLMERAFEEKIDWGSWITWRDNCNQLIPWDNGISVINIPKFEAHVVFTEDAILADALDQICAAAGAFWQDDGERLIFLPPTERAPVHHFNESNIAQPPNVQPRDLRERPNYFIAEYRDFDDDFLGLASVEVRRTDLIAQAGEIKSTRAMPVMRQSQAQRLLERQARLEADNPVLCTLTSDETSIHILPGDFVTVSHPLMDWTYQRCLVLSAVLSDAESAPDTCEFTLQKIDDFLYSDTAHGPRQEALTP